MLNPQHKNKRNTLTHAQILQLLLTQSKRKVRIRTIDTIFFTRNNDSTVKIASWYYTSNKGELIQRSDVGKLTIQNIHDRFSRISPQGSNKIVAVGYVSDEDSSTSVRRVTFTIDQLHREAKHGHSEILKKMICLQHYVYPSQEKHHHFRAIYSLRAIISENGEKEHKNDVEIYPIDDFDATADVDDKFVLTSDKTVGKTSLSALHEWVHKELDVMMHRLVQHIDFSLSIVSSPDMNDANIIQIVADFVLDDNKRLWMTSINRLVLDEDLSSLNHADLDEALSSSFKSFHSSISWNDMSTPSINTESNNVPNDTKLSEHDFAYEIDEQTCNEAASEENGDCHINDLQDNIRSLQKKLNDAKKLKDEKLIEINMLIPEIKRVIPDISSSNDRNIEERSQYDRESRKVHPQNMNAKQLEIVETEKPSVEDSIRHDNLQTTSFDYSCQSQRIHNLEIERNDLLKQMEEERYENVKNQKFLNAKNEELIEKERKTREELHLLLLEVEKDRKHFQKSLESIRVSNSLLEAELKSQREYVHKVRAQSYGELTLNIKKNIEDAIVQGITDSCMGVDNAVVSCEDIWRSRLEEMAKEHERTISAIHDDYRNDINYKEAQHKINLQNVKSEVEGRIQRQFSDSLRAAMDHKERQRQADLKNEMKRWEQILSEVKARMQNDNQNELSKILKERDEHWQNKMKQLEADHLRMINSILEEKKDMMEQLLNANKEEIDKVLEQAEIDKCIAIKCALDDVKLQHDLDLQNKDSQFRSEVQKMKQEMKELGEIEVSKQVAEAIEKESSKIGDANAVISQLRAERDNLFLHHEAEIDQLKGKMDFELKEKEKQIMSMAMQIQQVDVEKLNAHYEEKLEEIQLQHQDQISKVVNEANSTVKKEIEKAKSESEKAFDATINELTLEHDEKLQALDYEIGWLKTQHKNAVLEVKSLKEELSSKDQEIYKLKEDIDCYQVRYSFQSLFLITKALVSNRNLDVARDEISKITLSASKAYSDVENKLTDTVKELEKNNSVLEDKMKLIGSTLLNYKREELLNHKIRSREVASLITNLAKKIEMAEAKKVKALSILDNLELSMHDIEKQLQEHAQTSALEKGKINLNHTRKKRRLDEEYEQILSKIELQRDEVNNVEEEVSRLSKDKNSATEDMRKLEKSLVELLIEQQKKLLNISLRDDSS